MRTARTRTKHISASARCSSLAALLLLMLLARPCGALNVSGVPEWLMPAVRRSINAVWSEIPNDPMTDREGTLSLVASRLFTGYDVEVKAGRYEPAVFFVPNDKSITPSVNIVIPELRGMAAEWFSRDISGMSEEVSGVAGSIPQGALTWADEALRERVREIVSSHLPGWEFTQQIYISHDETRINLTFRPSTPMVLAVKPSLYSRTVPAMFRSDLEAKLIPEFSPLIGIPVRWAERHKPDIEEAAREFLEDRHSVENLRASVSVNFSPGVTSGLDAMVDSRELMFQLWVSAYAGLEGRYPEAGIFFGFRPEWGRYTPELYAEAVVELEDFDVTTRLGGRFEVYSNLWAGVEVQWPENKYFLRLQYIPVKVRRLYALWRWSPELDVHEAALGYRVDEHVSVEIYYFSEGDEKLGLRGTWHL